MNWPTTNRREGHETPHTRRDESDPVHRAGQYDAIEIPIERVDAKGDRLIGIVTAYIMDDILHEAITAARASRPAAPEKT